MVESPLRFIGRRCVKIYLITPKNPPSFWTYDRILPTLGKRCIFPNLSMPTLAGLTGPEHEVVLCDENVGTSTSTSRPTWSG